MPVTRVGAICECTRMTDPLPLPLGDNAAYALPLAEGGVLLVDAGPDIPGAEDGTGDSRGTWGEAVALLAASGLAPADVRAVLITHWHLDHSGLAWRWAAEGARILAGAADIEAITTGQAWNDARVETRLRTLIEHGCPPELADALRAADAAPAPRLSLAGLPARGRRGGRRRRGVRPRGRRAAACRRRAGAHARQPRRLRRGDGRSLLRRHAAAAHDADAGAALPRGRRPRSQWRRAGRALALAAAVRGVGGAAARAGRAARAAGARRARSRARRRSGCSCASSGITSDARRGCARCSRERPDSAYGLVRRLFPHLPDSRLAQALTELIGQLDVLVARGDALAEPRDGVLLHRLAR